MCIGEENIIKIGEPVLTRYERARIVGARALQISHGAPVLIDTDEDDFRPHDVAMKELKNRVLPIGLARRVPNGETEIIPVHQLKDREFITQIDTVANSSIDSNNTESSGLGISEISGVGESTADDLKAAGFTTVESIANASVADLSKVKGIGKASAKKLIDNAKELL